MKTSTLLLSALSAATFSVAVLPVMGCFGYDDTPLCVEAENQCNLFINAACDKAESCGVDFDECRQGFLEDFDCTRASDYTGDALDCIAEEKRLSCDDFFAGAADSTEACRDFTMTIGAELCVDTRTTDDSTAGDSSSDGSDSGSSSGTCGGTPQSCFGASDSFSCSGILGCAWNGTSCSGSPMGCESVGTNCEIQPGCFRQ